MARRWILLGALCLAVGGGAAQAAKAPPQVVQVCEDSAEWPPYSYYRRDKGRKTSHVVGFSVDVLRTILAHAERPARILLIPWTRCLREVKAGRTLHVAMDTLATRERGGYFHFSRPYYRTRGYYFYSRQRHPEGLRIRGSSDLAGYRICGIRDYATEPFGLPSSQVERRSRTFGDLARKVKAGRCDLFLADLEVMRGFQQLGQDFLRDPGLGHAPIPELAPIPYHFAVSRRAPGAEQLVREIDEGLRRLERSGELEALRRRYEQGN